MSRVRAAAAPISLRTAPQPGHRGRVRRPGRPTGGAVLIAAAALALRLTGLSGVAPDPFYDAAVRSMGTSWHDFLFGALEPGGSVAIDKPAVALWPQVAATKLLGFSTLTLLLPSAVAGLAGVALAGWFASLVWGRFAGWAAAAALAVAPLAVLTDRSDTMDAAAVALALLAAAAIVAAARAEAGGWQGRPSSVSGNPAHPPPGRWLLAGAGAAIGAAFAVKLGQALIPVPALAALYLAASPLALGERLSRLVLCAAVAAGIGLSWFLVVSTAPGREQPWAYGSRDGTAISAAFAYDGLDRLARPRKDGPRGEVAGGEVARGGGAGARGAVGRGESAGARGVVARGDGAGARGEAVAAGDYGAVTVAAAGPGRLVSARGGLRGLLGVELLPAAVVGVFAVVFGWRAGRIPRAGVVFVAAWLATGVVVLSAMPDLKVRYVDVLAPPAAIALGAGIVSLAQRRAVGGVLLAGLLVAPGVQAVRVVRSDASDSGHLGALTPAEARSLSRFLAGQPRTRYELASATAAKAAPLIALDDRPVLMLGTQLGHELTSLRTLRKDVRDDEVRYVLSAGPCGPHTWREGCGRAARWAAVHGEDVSREAGLSVRTLYALIPASARAGTHDTRHARRLAFDPDRRRRVDAARDADTLVPTRGARHDGSRRR
jgi:4-amino-4-deoxy-L-arabinose transferase-like glycosyltransferase